MWKIVFCTVFALALEKNKVYNKTDRKLRRTIEEGEKNTSSFRKKQNFEIYAATIRRRNQIAREIHYNAVNLKNNKGYYLVL